MTPFNKVLDFFRGYAVDTLGETKLGWPDQFVKESFSPDGKRPSLTASMDMKTVLQSQGKKLDGTPWGKGGRHEKFVYGVGLASGVYTCTRPLVYIDMCHPVMY